MFTDFGCALVHSAPAVGVVGGLELSGSGVGVCSDQAPDFVSRFLTTLHLWQLRYILAPVVLASSAAGCRCSVGC